MPRAQGKSLDGGGEAVEQRATATLIWAAAEAALAAVDVAAPENLRIRHLAERQESQAARSAAIQFLGEDLVALQAAGPGADFSLRLAVAHRLGQWLDTRQALLSSGRGSGDQTAQRRTSGSYFTPPNVAASLVTRSLPFLDLHDGFRLCDPAMGGGAFLLEAVASLRAQKIADGLAGDAALSWALARAFGVDVNPLAVATAELALLVLGATLRAAPSQLRVDDALFPQAPLGPFDWIVGNPPWVSFQGRAAQKLSDEERAKIKRQFRSFRGYPTLHGVFVERAAQLAPKGVISLLLPSSVADLDGYRSARACLRAEHEPVEPLLEYGQDAFTQVVQPCFGLVARARPHSRGEVIDGAERPWALLERASLGSTAAKVEVPEALLRLGEHETFPKECFGELGFQSNRQVSQELFLRSKEPSSPFVLPLLEGRNVGEFEVRAPGLFLNNDVARLKQAKVRLRSLADYRRPGLVVRQTASVTIAALHQGQVFRNSLLAGYAVGYLTAPLLVGLLNSSLYRALHVSRSRDARQAVFPQVKVAHLRALPVPPNHSALIAKIEALTQEATSEGFDEARRLRLDAAVFKLFSLSAKDGAAILTYLSARGPRPKAPTPPA